MESAVEPLRDILRQLEVRRPEIAVHSNIDGKRYMHDKHVRRQLAKQLVSPVKWEQTLHEIYERTEGQEFPQTYEVGPGRQLGATLQKCNMKAYKSYTHIDVALPEDKWNLGIVFWWTGWKERLGVFIVMLQSQSVDVSINVFFQKNNCD